MNPVRVLYLAALCLVASVCVGASGKSLKPIEWLSTAELEALSAAEELTWSQLESMPVAKGAEMLQQLYHLAQINHDITPTFVPSPSNIPVYIVSDKKVETTLSQLPATAQEQPNFGDDEITIFVTTLPNEIKSVSKATRRLVQAYQKRNKNHQQQKDNSGENRNRASSEEDSEATPNWGPSKGYLVIIDLGHVLTTFKRFAKLDVEKTGEMLGNTIIELEKKCAVPETIHIVAQGIAAQVAGAAGRQHIRLIGQKLRRITALDPSKVFAKNPNTLTGLARGDAEFVDAIHTSAYGLGVSHRVGNVDFYPNGPSAAVPGADNVIEASMRATRYFAESVIPGNERNFPAVPARSFEEYKSNDGYGKRNYMGINTQPDEGDLMLEVRPNAPFGKSRPAQKQNTYHGMHQPLKNMQ